MFMKVIVTQTVFYASLMLNDDHIENLAKLRM